MENNSNNHEKQINNKTINENKEELCNIILRQTNYSEQEVLKKLEEHNNKIDDNSKNLYSDVKKIAGVIIHNNIYIKLKKKLIIPKYLF